MSISLVKGQKIDLTKGNAGLNKVVFGLGWDTNRYDGNADFDLDVSAFFTDNSGKVTGEQDFVFYGFAMPCDVARNYFYRKDLWLEYILTLQVIILISYVDFVK